MAKAAKARPGRAPTLAGRIVRWRGGDSEMPMESSVDVKVAARHHQPLPRHEVADPGAVGLIAGVLQLVLGLQQGDGVHQAVVVADAGAAEFLLGDGEGAGGDVHLALQALDVEIGLAHLQADVADEALVVALFGLVLQHQQALAALLVAEAEIGVHVEADTKAVVIELETVGEAVALPHPGVLQADVDAGETLAAGGHHPLPGEAQFIPGAHRLGAPVEGEGFQVRHRQGEQLHVDGGEGRRADGQGRGEVEAGEDLQLLLGAGAVEQRLVAAVAGAGEAQLVAGEIQGAEAVGAVADDRRLVDAPGDVLLQPGEALALVGQGQLVVGGHHPVDAELSGSSVSITSWPVLSPMLKPSQRNAVLMERTSPGARVPLEGFGVLRNEGAAVTMNSMGLPPTLVMAKAGKGSGQGLPPTIWVFCRLGLPAGLKANSPGSGTGASTSTSQLTATEPTLVLVGTSSPSTAAPAALLPTVKPSQLKALVRFTEAPGARVPLVAPVRITRGPGSARS